MRRIVIDEEALPDFDQMLSGVLTNAGPDKPFSSDEVIRAVEIRMKLDGRAKGELVLEDEEFKFVEARVNGAKWLRADDKIVALIKTVRSAETVKATKVEKVKQAA